MYALMTRAMRNVGDDLIHARGRRLIEHLVPSIELVQANAHQRLEQSLDADQISALRGILVPGGPGARKNIEAVYPFLADAAARRIPVYFLGVGSRYFPGTFDPATAAIDPATVTRLRQCSSDAPIGVRDYLTLNLLRAHGIAAQMNGCPAWYSLDHIDRRPTPPDRLSRIALTTPGDRRFVSQSLSVMRHVRSLFASADVLVGFHHGIDLNDPVMGAANARIVAQAHELGFECVDLAAKHEKLAIYDDCDIHVGYRVHAHIYFSSLRKPSVLLAEDSRGSGVLHALGGVGRAAWRPIAENPWSRRALTAARGLASVAAPDAEICPWLELSLQREQELGFPHLQQSSTAIDSAYRGSMRPFILELFCRDTSAPA
jgi:hypothetical protein